MLHWLNMLCPECEGQPLRDLNGRFTRCFCCAGKGRIHDPYATDPDPCDPWAGRDLEDVLEAILEATLIKPAD